MRKFLHVGCGYDRNERSISALMDPSWTEVRLDIDADTQPDIVDSLPDLAKVESDSFDLIYSSHNIEHLYSYQVPLALRSFLRVLKDDGLAIITCPDIQSLGEKIAKGDIESELYMSRAGPISVVDVLFGFRQSIHEGSHYMAHHMGFTQASFEKYIGEAGFGSMVALRRPARFDIWILATKKAKTQQELEALGQMYLKLLN